MNEKYKMIKEFIEMICDELDIDIPSVSCDPTMFDTSTAIAYFDGETIYLKDDTQITPDTCFAIAHELRHAWQIKHHEKAYFEAYKGMDALNHNVEAYNLQKAEIDANAYANVIMIECFSIKPLFQGLPTTVIDAIQKRVTEIINE